MEAAAAEGDEVADDEKLTNWSGRGELLGDALGLGTGGPEGVFCSSAAGAQEIGRAHV